MENEDRLRKRIQSRIDDNGSDEKKTKVQRAVSDRRDIGSERQHSFQEPSNGGHENNHARRNGLRSRNSHHNHNDELSDGIAPIIRRITPEAQRILKLISSLGKQAEVMITGSIATLTENGVRAGAHAASRALGIEVSEEAINNFVTKILNVVKKIIDWVKNQVIDFIKQNPWKCLIAGLIGVGIGCAILLPGTTLAAEYLGVIGITNASAATIVSTIAGSLTGIGLIKKAIPLFATMANFIMDEVLTNEIDEGLYTNETLDITDRIFVRSNIPQSLT